MGKHISSKLKLGCLIGYKKNMPAMLQLFFIRGSLMRNFEPKATETTPILKYNLNWTISVNTYDFFPGACSGK